MRADLTKVRQVLFNLLSNAAKFTEDGAVRIDAARVSARRTGLDRFAVHDTGIGMTAEQIATAVPGLHPGRRLDHAQVRRHRPGPGDQPALLRDDGRQIAVESEPGRGSTFRFELPAEVSSAPRARNAQPRAAEPRQTRAPAADKSSLSSTTIRPCATIARLLTKDGFRVTRCQRTQAGACAALNPAAITLDVMMPRMDGWAVLNALKGGPRRGRHPRRHGDHDR